MRTFIDVATETIFGTLWTRPGLDLKTRTLITLVSDAATGREAELAIHLRMALRQGWTEEELTEALIHLVGYVGAPLVREALLTARDLSAAGKKEGGPYPTGGGPALARYSARGRRPRTRGAPRRDTGPP